MATLEDKIADLEVEMEGYKRELADAKTLEEKKDLRKLIASGHELLKELLTQQKEQTREVAHSSSGVISSWFGQWWNYLFGTAQLNLKIEVEKVLDCTVYIKSSTGARGNGIIVHPDKLLTSLHGYFKKNDPFEIVDRHGVSRRGFVLDAWYAEDEVDIAVIQLSPESRKFVSFVPVSADAVQLGDDLYFISRRAVGNSDHYTNCLERSVVTAVIDDTSIFHSSYYAEVGMFGCGVVATLRGHSFLVVGVHCASHDKTTAVKVKADNRPRSKKKRKMNSGKNRPVSREEFEDAMMTVNSDIHGHGAYSLICDVARVEGLLNLLK